MIRSVAIYESRSHDPYRNLAIEQHLLETARDRCILYLWQNENTVVIGRNQNPWKECKTTLLNEEGGHLARRLSGGGAVFHDLGNLNFTFLLPQEDYDLQRQLTVVCQAVRSVGIPAQLSGRNDILAQGRKFSGNAFYKSGKQAYHHGTLLVDADMTKMSRYLNPSKAKLQSKGVDSVRSRVLNLKELSPSLTVEALKGALVEAFSQVYDLPLERLRDEDLDQTRIDLLTAHHGSWDWNFGRKMPFTLECEERFSWGNLNVQLQIEGGVIRDAKIYSDAMDWERIPQWEQALRGCRLERTALQALPLPEELYCLLCDQAL